MSDNANKPVVSTRDRNLSISVFARQTTDQQGVNHTSYGACLQRSYRKKDASDWTREQINLFPEELLKLAALCVRTYNDTIAYAQANQPQGGSYPAQTLDEPIDNALPNDAIPF